MSWNFRKSRKSVPTEDDVARECEKIKSVEEASKRMLKDGKKMADTDFETAKAAKKLASDLNALQSENASCNCAVILAKTMDDCGSLADKKYQLLQKTLIKPMKWYGDLFPHLNGHIKSHDKAQQDYKKLKAKMDKIREKGDTGPNIVKMNNMKRELVPVEEEFDAKHRMLLDEFPAFYNGRLQYLQPIFEAVVRSECWYHHQLQELFDKTLNELTQTDPDVDLEAEVNDTLEQIRGLSITKD